MLSKVLGGLRPDVTPAQVVAVLIAGIPILANLLRAFGVFDMGEEQQKALADAVQWGGIAAIGLFLADAGVRSARNVKDGKVQAAALVAGATPPVGPPAGSEPAAPEDAPVYEDPPLLPGEDAGTIGADVGDPPTRPT